MALWKDIAEALSPDDGQRREAEALAAECAAGIPAGRTQSSLLRLPDAVIALFYAGLEAARSPRRACREEPDSSWMLRSDFCYVSVRASGHDDRPGSFLQAAKLLPGTAASAIHLAPFHPVHFDVVYAPENQSTVDPSLADPALAAAGIGPEDQLRAFSLACRLLGKAVGYDLLPHIAQFGRTVVERPSLFRWVQLDPARRSISCEDPVTPYRREDRLRIAALVEDLVGAIKEDYGLSTFKREEGDLGAQEEVKDRAYFAAIRQCIDRGLWPVLSQAWNGVGIPAFLRYERGGDFPVFSYRDAAGADVGADSYGVVAPYAFYDGVPPNSLPEEGCPPSLNREAVDYWSGIYSRWRDGYGFDFVRYDSLDHVLDSVTDDADRLPVSDRPTPEVLAAATAASRSGGAGATGALAERMGAEFAEYADMGFDLVLGSDWLRRIDAPLMRDSFALYDRLAARASVPGSRPASVCFAVDCHDAGDSRFWGSSLAAVMGPERMSLRHMVARFCSVGPGRRPLYEVMGFQDLSTGLYASTISARGMDWADDRAAAARYASIERSWARLRPFLESAAIVDRRVEDRFAWWLVADPGRNRLVAVTCSLETADGAAPGRVEVPLGKGWGRLGGECFRPADGKREPAEADGRIVADLAYLDLVVHDMVPMFF